VRFSLSFLIYFATEDFSGIAFAIAKKGAPHRPAGLCGAILAPQIVQLIPSKLEPEVRGEAARVPLSPRIEITRRNAIEFSQVTVNHDLLTANGEDAPLRVLLELNKS